MKSRYLFAGAILGLTLMSPSLAQNPFVPPSGGLTKAQVEAIVRTEVAKSGGIVSPGAPGAPGIPGASGVSSQMVPPGAVGALPSQRGGSPTANVASTSRQGDAAGALAEIGLDPIDELLKAGGSFVGCVADTPVFRDANGRRAYFTSEELRGSSTARRFARCK